MYLIVKSLILAGQEFKLELFGDDLRVECFESLMGELRVGVYKTAPSGVIIKTLAGFSRDEFKALGSAQDELIEALTG